jgi:ElaB/YqjD/DUF883 family membrane-anchored ribosome-binding protein
MAQAATKSDAEQLRDDMAALRNDMNALMKHVRQLGDSATQEARAGLAATGTRLRENIERTAQTAKARGQENIAALEHTVRERPLTAIALAFGLGMLVSRLLPRDH